MRISKQNSLLLLTLSFFTIGCKTSEPIRPKAIEKVQEKAKAIESFEPKYSTENYLLKDDIAGSVGMREYSEAHRLGTRKVDINFLKKGSGLTFVNLHDNENTSVKAAFIVIDSIGGRIIQLQHTEERNIQFNLESVKYEFDPNRMFTDLGAEETLKRYSKMSGKAHKSIRALAKRVVDSLDQRMIVTLHNNSEDNYSSLSYLDEYKNDAVEVYINPDKDPDDFFFVTTKELFDAFKKLGYNTVLQNNDTMTDDGSLSVLAGQQDIPYINVEAQHGHLEEQVKMLFALVKMLE